MFLLSTKDFERHTKKPSYVKFLALLIITFNSIMVKSRYKSKEYPWRQSLIPIGVTSCYASDKHYVLNPIKC